MSWPAGLCVGLVLVGLIHLGYCLLFVLRRHPDKRPSEPKGATWPKASILLSLRGADPSLAQGLRSLMTQDYPDYQLRIIVDSPGDPAWGPVEDSIRETGCKRVHVDLLRDPLETCSLKCSALAQMVEGLEPECEVIALADADLEFRSDWLRELVGALQKRGTGAVCGFRWFVPSQGRWGSLMRYLWNAAAIVAMELVRIPWGGSLAMRVATVRDANIVDMWRRSGVEDVPLRRVLRERGLEVRFAPSLMMVSREECGVRSALWFIRRQLTWVRLYHQAGWPPLVVHAVLEGGLLCGSLILGLWALFAGRVGDAVWLGAGLTFYHLSWLGLLAILERHLWRRIDPEGRENRDVCRDGPPLRPPGVFWRRFLAIPLAVSGHLAAVAWTAGSRRVPWRGINYRIDGPWKIRRLDYAPYDSDLGPRDGKMSL